MIFECVEKENVDELKKIITKKNINMLNDFHHTPLLVASALGHEKIVKILIENDADPNHQDKAGWTALHYVASGSNTELAEILIEHGASKEINCFG